MTDAAPPHGRALHALVALLLLGHAAGALLVLRLAPPGFPVDHPRFWLHEALPWATVVGSIALIARPRWGASAMLGLWVGIAAAMVGLFREEGVFPAGLAGVAALAALGPAVRLRPHAAGLPALCVGALATLALRAPPPTTTPGGEAPDAPPLEALPVHLADRLVVSVDPRLAVHDGSRTGFQTVFGAGPTPIPAALYGRQGPGTTDVTAVSTVERPVYAHLSSYAQLQITGHTDLSVTFSPCPDAPIPVLPADYPWGRPMQLAYVDADRVFHVVRATSGEKGPYTALCEGRLDPGEPLRMTFLDAGVPTVAVTLHDWSAQLSTDLSPAAGYGLPQNAIQFQRGDAPTDPAWIHVALASTGIGIGWDSVGLAPGTYASRVGIETL
ncbi:MAG: hypothetical protein H6737_18995 [Alphaproteobacteria bacterium]|nr:hypothetical protein [Alphaproteobacteria bacterium]